MKYHLILSLSLLAFFTITHSYSQTDGENLFDDTFLHEVRFTSVDTNIYIQTKNYQMLDMSIDGMALADVGFKRKGNISGYPETNKYGIKIKTNKYTAGLEYDGIKEFTLHMNYQDPSLLREKLTYELADQLGLYSLRTAFAKVYINDIYWGVYTMVEGKDEMYKQVFDNRDMDAIESLDLGSMCYLGSNTEDYDSEVNGGLPYYTFENGNPETAWPRFVDMLDKANNTSINDYLNIVPDNFNLEDFFKYQALNVYLMNMDSYISFRGNQIYAYDETEEKWQVTPWDFNASFGLWDTQFELPTEYPLIPSAISNGCIASKMNDIPELRNYYLDAMCELHAILNDTDTYFDRIDMLKSQIEQAVYEDSRKVITNEQFDESFGFGNQSIFSEDIPRLKSFISERNQLIETGLEGEQHSCTFSIGDIEDISNQIIIYPNPAKKSFNISSGEIELNYGSLQLKDLAGRIIHSSDLSYTKQINVSDVSQGIYLLTLSNDKYIATRRIVIE